MQSNKGENKKIVFAHLYNDYSGSPKVLAQIIPIFVADKWSVTVLTSTENEGALSHFEATYKDNHYQYKGGKWQRWGRFLQAQARMFWQVLTLKNKPNLLYINTLLPFGAALAGCLRGSTVVYHIHETSVRPAWFKAALRAMVQLTATEVVFVSKFLSEAEAFPNKKTTIIYNSLKTSFWQAAQNHHLQDNKHTKKEKQFKVLLLGSLKKYKGIDTFVALAQKMTNCLFTLVLNADLEEIKHYFKETKLPENLTLLPRQQEVARFYKTHDLLLNLSDPDLWVETFGLTLLEGMAYGLPCLAPNAGGPLELVQDGKNGFLLQNVNDLEEIKEKINLLNKDKALYQKMSQIALQQAANFSPKQFQLAIQTLFLNLTN